jgi:hypothetical protein
MTIREFTTATPVAPEAGPIRVVVRDLGKMLNPIDPSPLRDRDLDTHAEQFILTWARDLPGRSELSLVVQLAGDPARRVEAEAVVEAVHAHFARKSATARRELRTLLRRGRTSLVIGIAFLSLCVTAANLAVRTWGAGGVSGIVHEGLTVAGWVSMWRPMEVFLYEWWPIVGDRQLYDRLSHMPVRVEPVEHS